MDVKQPAAEPEVAELMATAAALTKRRMARLLRVVATDGIYKPRQAETTATPKLRVSQPSDSGITLNSSTTPLLRVGGVNERGTTVKYIYALDPHYTQWVGTDSPFER